MTVEDYYKYKLLENKMLNYVVKVLILIVVDLGLLVAGYYNKNKFIVINCLNVLVALMITLIVALVLWIVYKMLAWSKRLKYSMRKGGVV